MDVETAARLVVRASRADADGMFRVPVQSAPRLVARPDGRIEEVLVGRDDDVPSVEELIGEEPTAPALPDLIDLSRAPDTVVPPAANLAPVPELEVDLGQADVPQDEHTRDDVYLEGLGSEVTGLEDFGQTTPDSDISGIREVARVIPRQTDLAPTPKGPFRASPLPPAPPPCGQDAGQSTAGSIAPSPPAALATDRPALYDQDANPIPDGLPEARLPNPAVPSFHIWPPSTGRETLRLVPYQRAVLRLDLQHCRGKLNGSGKSDTFVYRAGNWCLKTSPRRCFTAVEEARDTLVQLARRKVALGERLPPSTVLVLQESGVGYWLWTVTPWFRSLRFEMAEAEAIHSEAALGLVLRRYAQASVQALELLRGEQLALDVHPSNFAFVQDRWVYLDDDIEKSTCLPTIGYAWLMRVEEYGTATEALERYLSELELQIQRRLSREDVEQLRLEEAIDETMVQSELGRQARARLSRAVRHCR